MLMPVPNALVPKLRLGNVTLAARLMHGDLPRFNRGPFQVEVLRPVHIQELGNFNRLLPNLFVSTASSSLSCSYSFSIKPQPLACIDNGVNSQRVEDFGIECRHFTGGSCVALMLMNGAATGLFVWHQDIEADGV